MFARGRIETACPSSVSVKSTPPLQVAACVVRREDGFILMARRRADQSSPGFWEIPGGKLEVGESPVEAAARELREETNVSAKGLKPLISHIHDFPTRRIELSVFIAQEWDGIVKGCENQEIAWVDPSAPSVSPILSSNKRVLARLALPSTVLAVGAPLSNSAQWADSSIALANAYSAGAIMLLDTGLPVLQQRSLAQRMSAAIDGNSNTVWTSRFGTANRFSAIDFGHRVSQGNIRSSNEPLKGALLSIQKARESGAVEGLDLIMVGVGKPSQISGDCKSALFEICQRASGAVYAVIEEAHLGSIDCHVPGLQGLCIVASNSNININEVFG